MSARAEREIPIRYLSVDEMMLKIAEMRAARVPRMPLPPIQPAPRESVEPPPKLEFPDYISHYEAWSMAAKPVETEDHAKVLPVKVPLSRVIPSGASVSIVQPVATRNRQPSPPARSVLRR